VTPEAFAAFVCGPLDQLVQSVAACSMPKASDAAGALYDVALELFAQNLLGPETRSPAVADLWQRVLPLLARWLADDPRGVAAAVSNILFNLEQEDAGVAARWTERVAVISAACDSAPALLDAAQVLAWRSGMAHYRDGALARWRGLPEGAKFATLGLPSDTPDLSVSDLERGLANPWWLPAIDGGESPEEIRLVARVGGFQGVDGPFIRPPQVACSNGLLLAFDREGCWSIHADSFGATLKHAGTCQPDHTDLPSAAFAVSASGQVRRGTLAATIPALRDATSCASTESTLAVTLRHSHQVHLVAVSRHGLS
jgi:hypothetical protein